MDRDMIIINAYTGWPGCVHDARVLRYSSLFAEAGQLFAQNHHILADNAYPLQNWLITPFKNFGKLTRLQLSFNIRLSSVRQTVERAFGHLKGRFRRLREIPLHNSEDICKRVYTGCILHNMCILHKDDVVNYVENDNNNDPNACQNVFQNWHIGVLRQLEQQEGG